VAEPARRLKGPALAALIASVVAAAAPVLTEPNEGYRGKAYRDPARYLTQCYGERQVDPSTVYSQSQCATKLRLRMARDFGPGLVRCVPDLANPAYKLAFGALLDSAYNAGVGGACGSPMAREFRAGRWSDGCRVFVGWRETARGTRYTGLVRRRREEAVYCLTGKRA